MSSALKRSTDKYRDIAALGSGGMGDVFLSVARADGLAGFRKLLVIKRIRRTVADDPDILKMFLNEARLAARLMHPNVVQTNEVGFDGNRHFIAMEYLDGQSLLTVLRRAKSGTPFPRAMHLRVLADTLNGLHYAHELADFDGTPLQIVHRDATPHNVFITYEGQVKIVDFGIAKVGQTGDTRTGELKGKVPYLSPEQVTGARIDRRCDVWAVGVMLWEALARRRLWKASTEAQIVLGLGHGHISKVTDFAPDAPPKLLAIVERALAHRVEDRYPSAGEMLADLEAAMRALDEQVSARDVGQWVAESFAEDRVKLRALIDQQIKSTHDSPAPTRELPSIPPPHHSVTPIRTDETPSVSSTRSPSMEGTPIEVTPAVATPPSKTPLFIGLAVVLAAAAALGIFFGTYSRAPAPTDAPSTSEPKATPAAPVTSSAVSPAGTPIAKASPLRLVVKVDPEGAKVFVDDLELPPTGSELVLTTALDGLSHRVRVEAPGHATKAFWVAFDRTTVELDVKLERSDKPGAPIVSTIGTSKTSAAGSKSTTPPTTGTAPASTSSKAAPKSSIDTTAPF